MAPVVLDASVFISACSPTESHHAVARALLDAQPEARAFLVPAIFRLEVLAGLARRGESAAYLETIDALITGPRYYACPLDGDLLERAVRIACKAGLRAYDAVYAALAESRAATLLTLDSDVAARLSQALPAVATRP